jgi:hypothetical protein
MFLRKSTYDDVPTVIGKVEIFVSFVFNIGFSVSFAEAPKTSALAVMLFNWSFVIEPNELLPHPLITVQTSNAGNRDNKTLFFLLVCLKKQALLFFKFNTIVPFRINLKSHDKDIEHFSINNITYI